MPNEINANCSVGISASGQGVNGSATFPGDISVDGFLGEEQLIATVSTPLTVGDITTPKVVFIKNLDTTNFVQVDSATTFDKFPQKLYPNEGILLLPQTAAIYLKADTAACQIWVCIG